MRIEDVVIIGSGPDKLLQLLVWAVKQRLKQLDSWNHLKNISQLSIVVS